MAEKLAVTVLARLRAAYTAAADPAQAVSMRAYLRDQFPFLGIPAPQRRALAREVLAGLGRPAEDDLRVVALGCWELPEREYQYFACDWLRRHAKACTPDFLVTAHTLLTTKSWWDTVDALADHLVGAIVAGHPPTVSTMDDWIADDNLWLVRTAILHQLSYRDSTDSERLYRYCLAQSAHKDFFVRKAIGWALRQYAWTDPASVREFVGVHHGQLAPLSVREALKNLGQAS